MGFFDRFKKKNIVNNVQALEQLPFDIQYNSFSDGRLQVDFYDKNSDYTKFYDTTRLIVGQQPLNIDGHRVYKCAVSWYNNNDCQMLDERTGKFDILSAQEYRGVLAEIDLEQLQSNPEYCSKVMKDLLDKKRVERYLERGLQETPEMPCGNYIGGIKQTERGYKKFFSTTVGEVSHNSELMVNRRQKNREILAAKRKAIIANKEAQIAKLQSEVEEIMEK